MTETFRIQQMRQFVIAAESGSFRAAAIGTFRSAAAVSTAMNELEQQVGAPLFEKGQRARLTPLGQTLAPLFSELLRTHDRIMRDVRQIARAERGSLTVAVVPFLAEEWFSGVLGRFMSNHRGIATRVIDQRSRLARQMVADGQADIAIAAHLGDDPKLDFHPVAIDTLGIVCRQDDPLARRRRPATWDVLAERSLIGNDGFEALVARGLGQWIADNTVVTVSSRFSIMDCIRQGIGITVLPRLTKPPAATDMTFVQLNDPVVSRSLGIVTRRGQTLLPAAREMFALIERELRDYARTNGATLVGNEPLSPTRPTSLAAKTRRH
jgi:DNA-binding transcriptional LysR family regulator